MRITTKSRYGLRAMIQLTIDTIDKKTTTLKSIAEEQCLSERYLEQIFSILKKKKLVASTRGIRGGYAPARDPRDITVADILRALEDPVEIIDCLREDSCPDESGCISRNIWKKIYESMIESAEVINLHDVVALEIMERKDMDGKDGVFGPCRNNKDKR